MKRIVSKIDYDMQMIAKISPEKAAEIWNKIKDSSFIINQATEIVINKQNLEKTFFSPTICHYILSNPQDVDKSVYESLATMVLKNSNLNKLVVLNDTSFLELVKLHAEDYLDDLFINIMNCEIDKMSSEHASELKYVEYDEVEENAEKLMTCKNNSLNIALGEDEINAFSSLNHINIVSEKEHLNKLNAKENVNIIMLDEEDTFNHKASFEINSTTKLTRNKSQERR